jgi:MYXO-CTERM domain-containing protein
MVNALVRLSEGSAVEDHSGVPPWAFGALALVLLLVLLFAVTRFNPDR